MHYRFLIIFVLLSTAIFSFSQNTISKKNDTIVKGVIPGHGDSIVKVKMNEYNEMLKKADVYEVKTEKELRNITYYKSEARIFLDSALKVSKLAENDKSNTKFYVMQFNYLYDKSSVMANEADSIYKVAVFYKDTANKFNREAESLYLTFAENNKSVFDNDSTKHEIFVIQLGAGFIEDNLLKEAGSDLEVITPSDGIKRYIAGKFSNKESAVEYRKKMIDLGFVDAFVRTLDSLKY